jgi:exodeoxyribonuclease-3
MKLATWNVNSLKVRLPHLLDWIASAAPDVVCLQETKLEDHAFPRAEIEAAGFHVAFAGQKTYNGVAILSRAPLTDTVSEVADLGDPQKRLLAATVDSPAGGVRIVCTYIPNGQAVGSDKYAYKLGWLAALTTQLKAEIAAHPRLALLGDYNIAPEDRDVHDPQAWAGQILCSEPERAAFRELIGLGLVDTFRRFEQPEKSFSWWDYRMMGFRRNLGLRIDHILATPALAETCTACVIDKTPRGWERPSDHAPVIADFAGALA